MGKRRVVHKKGRVGMENARKIRKQFEELLKNGHSDDPNLERASIEFLARQWDISYLTVYRIIYDKTYPEHPKGRASAKKQGQEYDAVYENGMPKRGPNSEKRTPLQEASDDAKGIEGGRPTATEVSGAPKNLRITWEQEIAVPPSVAYLSVEGILVTITTESGGMRAIVIEIAEHLDPFVQSIEVRKGKLS